MIQRPDETIETIRVRHAKEIQIFQENCGHEDISDWVTYMWAPGHCGPDVRVCNICGKIIYKKDFNVFLED